MGTHTRSRSPRARFAQSTQRLLRGRLEKAQEAIHSTSTSVSIPSSSPKAVKLSKSWYMSLKLYTVAPVRYGTRLLARPCMKGARSSSICSWTAF